MREPNVALFFIAGTFIIMCFAVAVITGFVVYKQRQVRSIVARKEAEAHYAATLLRTRLEVQEATLTNVSRELHDNVIQVLTSGVIRLNNAAPLIAGTPGADVVAAAKEAVRAGISDLRRLSHSLNTGLIEQRDLTDVLRAELERFRSLSGITCALEADEERQPGPEQRLLLFRIAQEALQNVLKHAGAGAVTVSLHSAGSAYTMRIADDGRGFERDTAGGAAAGIGLRNMEERAAAMGGAFRLDSTPGRGAIITVSIPLSADDAADTNSAGR